MKLYDYIRLLREQSELSQVDFAKKIGMCKSYLCDLEKDRRTISIKKAIMIANKLNISPIELLEIVLQDSLCRAGLNYIIILRNNDE